MNDWNQTLVGPRRDTPAKVDVRHLCPAVYRGLGLVGFILTTVLSYRGGAVLLGLHPMNWADPDWSLGQVLLIAAALVFGFVGGIFAAGFGMTIRVRSEGLSHFLLSLWHFTTNTSLIWSGILGTAISLVLGKEVTQQRMVQFGMENAFLEVMGSGLGLGMVLGLVFFALTFLRLRAGVWVFALLLVVPLLLLTAKTQYDLFQVPGLSWLFVSCLSGALTFLFSAANIHRDSSERRRIAEQCATADGG